VTEVYLFWTDNADYWEDITPCIETRISALAQHASQVGLDIEKLATRIREHARQAGEHARQAGEHAREAGEQPGYEYAEGFKRFHFRNAAR
jgi:LmbE family N-acetylglucosaminyl deacetylase